MILTSVLCSLADPAGGRDLMMATSPLEQILSPDRRSRSSIHVGVLGCGKIAERHLNAYRKLGARVTVSDIASRGEMIANNYDATWQPDPQQLLAGDGIDAIDVCTPTPTHSELICSALDHGKHVFCEKPLAGTVAEAELVRARAQETDRIVTVGYLYRFHPAFQFVKQVLDEGVIGDPRFATFRLGGRGSHKAWKHRRESGGGAGSEMMVHMIDLALWYFGEPIDVENLYTATMLPEREIDGEVVSVDAEDLSLLRVESRGGVQSFCQADLLTPGYMNHVEIQGTNGSLMSSILEYLPTTVYCKEPRGIFDRGHTFESFPKVDLFERQLDHFLGAISGEFPPAINSIDDSIRLMKAIEHVLHSRASH